MTVDRTLAIHLVDEIESLGIRLYFDVVDGDIELSWSTPGIAKGIRARQILQSSLKGGAFTNAFKAEIEKRYKQGRLGGAA